MKTNNLSIQVEGLSFSTMIGAGSDVEANYGWCFLCRKGYKVVPTQGYTIYSIFDNDAFDYVARNQLNVEALNSGEYRILQSRCKGNDKPDFVGRLLLYYHRDNPEMLELLYKKYRVAHHENRCREDNERENFLVLPNQQAHKLRHSEIDSKVSKRSVETLIREKMVSDQAYDLLINNLVEVYERIVKNRLYGGIRMGGIGGIVFDSTFLSEDYHCLSLQQIKDRVVKTVEFCYRYEPMPLHAEGE